MVKVRLLSHGPMKGKFNMAVDEAIFNAYQRGEVGPTLRFYMWKPACLSVGRFQEVEGQIDFESLRQMGVDLVRRPTGGRAVLHDHELTYSLVVSEQLLPGSVVETYRAVSQALVEGLRSLGVPAELAEVERGVTARDQRFKNAACFSAPSWYEVEAYGKKIIGSAQVRQGGAILQHGSIPLSMDAGKLARCFVTRTAGEILRLERMLSGKAAGLLEVCGRHISAWELEAALTHAFRATFGWEIERGCLTAREIGEAVILSQSKYGHPDWTMKRAGAGARTAGPTLV